MLRPCTAVSTSPAVRVKKAWAIRSRLVASGWVTGVVPFSERRVGETLETVAAAGLEVKASQTARPCAG